MFNKEMIMEQIRASENHRYLETITGSRYIRELIIVRYGGFWQKAWQKELQART